MIMISPLLSPPRSSSIPYPSKYMLFLHSFSLENKQVEKQTNHNKTKQAWKYKKEEKAWETHTHTYMQIHTHTGTHTCTHTYACTETHKNTKSEIMVDNQKTSKIKNAQNKAFENIIEFILGWPPTAGHRVCPKYGLCVQWDSIGKISFSFASN